MAAQARTDSRSAPARPRQVDPRGMRFAACLTSLVLAVVLLTGSGWLLLAQAIVFALGAGLGLRFSPYSVLFRRVVRPRIGPPAETEDEPAPRFAQAVGLVFAGVGVLGFAVGVPLVGLLATGCALVAALLNAAVGLCLGCELYLRAQVLRASRIATRSTPHTPHIPSNGAAA